MITDTTLCMVVKKCMNTD